MLLRLARNLRRETEALGVTSHQATLLALVRSRPGLSLRELASEEGISAPSLSGHVDRLEVAGLLRRIRSSDDRRRVGLELTADGRALLKRIRARRTTWLAERLGRLSDEERERVERALAALAALLEPGPTVPCLVRPEESRSERPRARTREPDVPLAPSPPQLPPLLRRAGRLARGHLDAEHRARVARDRALRLGSRRRRARLLPLRAVPPARAGGRGAHRPLRHASAPRRDAGDRDARLDRPRDRDAHRVGDAPARLRSRRGRRRRPRLRRAGPSDAHLPDGRAERAAERGRAQLRALQRLPRDRAGDRRRRDRARRHRALLRRQCRQLPLGARLAAPDARGGTASGREAPGDTAPGRDPGRPRVGVRRAGRAGRPQRDHRRQPRRLQLPRARAPPCLADARRRRRDLRDPRVGVRARRARRRARDSRACGRRRRTSSSAARPRSARSCCPSR